MNIRNPEDKIEASLLANLKKDGLVEVSVQVVPGMLDELISSLVTFSAEQYEKSNSATPNLLLLRLPAPKIQSLAECKEVVRISSERNVNLHQESTMTGAKDQEQESEYEQAASMHDIMEAIYENIARAKEDKLRPRRPRERYHTARQYEIAGIGLLRKHVAQFLADERTVPVVRAPAETPLGTLFFTFSNELYRLFLNNPKKIQKPYECAMKFGFRGFSAGGKNGVFLIRKQDVGLLKGLDSLIEKSKSEILADLDCSDEDLSMLRKIKIVYHEPSGERVVGLMNDTNGRAIFLGFARY